MNEFGLEAPRDRRCLCSPLPTEFFLEAPDCRTSTCRTGTVRWLWNREKIRLSLR